MPPCEMKWVVLTITPDSSEAAVIGHMEMFALERLNFVESGERGREARARPPGSLAAAPSLRMARRAMRRREVHPPLSCQPPGVGAQPHAPALTWMARPGMWLCG